MCRMTKKFGIFLISFCAWILPHQPSLSAENPPEQVQNENSEGGELKWYEIFKKSINSDFKKAVEALESANYDYFSDDIAEMLARALMKNRYSSRAERAFNILNKKCGGFESKYVCAYFLYAGFIGEPDVKKCDEILDSTSYHVFHLFHDLYWKNRHDSSMKDFFYHASLFYSKKENNQIPVGICYEHGIGVEKNLEKALKIYESSPDLMGYGIHKYHMLELYLTCMSPENDKKAFEIAKNNMGDFSAGNTYARLAWFYFLGIGVKKDDKKAFETVSEGLASPPSNRVESWVLKEMLARFYEKGIGVEKDAQKARETRENLVKTTFFKYFWDLSGLYANGAGEKVFWFGEDRAMAEWYRALFVFFEEVEKYRDKKQGFNHKPFLNAALLAADSVKLFWQGEEQQGRSKLGEFAALDLPDEAYKRLFFIMNFRQNGKLRSAAFECLKKLAARRDSMKDVLGVYYASYGNHKLAAENYEKYLNYLCDKNSADLSGKEAYIWAYKAAEMYFKVSDAESAERVIAKYIEKFPDDKNAAENFNALRSPKPENAEN